MCGAVGKVQEMEVLKVTGACAPLVGCYWIRSRHGDMYSEYSYIAGSENMGDKYTLCPADSGCYISFQQSLKTSSEGRDGNEQNKIESEDALSGEQGERDSSSAPSEGAGEIVVRRARFSVGPVLPGPPRLLDLCIRGETKCGSKVYAEANYIGGEEGCSEYWWVRIRGGKREQLGDPRPLSAVHSVAMGGEGEAVSDFDDPRVRVLCEEDVGCTLKVKCRPVRADGYRGEVFTSKACGLVTSKNEDRGSELEASTSQPAPAEIAPEVQSSDVSIR